MNTQLQYLIKRNERLANQTKVLMAAFENLSSENEYLMSVACGFAWDLAETVSESFDERTDPVAKAMIMEWDEAIAAVEKQNEVKP